MNPVIAKSNLAVLSTLTPYTKLKADREGALSIEDRYIPSVQRTLTSDSRDKLMQLLRQTFDAAEVDNTQKTTALQQLQTVLAQTYPDYEPLKQTFDEMLAKFSGIFVGNAETPGAPAVALESEPEEPLPEEFEEKLSLLHTMSTLNFKPSMQNTFSVETKPDRIIVTTNKSRNGYLLSSRPISLAGLKTLEVNFEVHLLKGGFGIGLLDCNGKWVPNSYKNFNKKPFVKNVIQLNTETCTPGNDVMVVFYNCCSPADTSQFEIVSVDCLGFF